MPSIPSSSPEDEAARLVLADQLLEQGDPRGELIVVQCELARCPRHEPRWYDLVARERDLLREHEARWLAELPDVGVRYVLVRGLVEKAVVPAARVGIFLQSLEEMPDLRSLEITRFGGLLHFASLPAAGRLRSLRLVNPTAAAMSALGEVALPALRELEVVTVFEEDEPPLVNQKYLAGALRAHGALTRLALGGGQFEPPGLRLVARAGLERLDRLALSDEDFDRGDLAALTASPSWPRLLELDLSRCRLGDDGAVALARAAPPGLERLSVEGNGIGPRGAAALAGLEVRDLRVSGNPLGDAGLAALAGGLGGLRILAAAEVQAGAEGMRALAGAGFASELVALDVSDNPLGERGGGVVCAAPLEGLRALRLAGTHLGDAFVALRAPALRVLDVTRCGLDAPALSALAGRQLLELRAGGNDLGDDGVAAAAPLGLQLLDLSNTGLGAGGVRMLATDPRFARLVGLDVGQNRLSRAQIDSLVARFGRITVGRARFRP